MNPLVAFGLADLARAEEAKDQRLIWRNTSATVPIEAIKRDGRWAEAISHWASAEPERNAVDSRAGGCATA
jgi:hypothetical protein